MADIRPTYGLQLHTPDIRPKTDSKLFIMSWTVDMRPIHNTTDMRLTYAEYTADIWPKTDSKIIIRLGYGYHSCLLYGDQDFSFRPYIWRMSAVCRPCLPYACRMHPLYISHISTVYQLSVSRILAVYQLNVCGITAVFLPHIRRMSAIPNLPIRRTSKVPVTEAKNTKNRSLSPCSMKLNRGK